jgi:hypothetical protein
MWQKIEMKKGKTRQITNRQLETHWGFVFDKPCIVKRITT